MSKALADILLKDKIITAQQYQEALSFSQKNNTQPLNYLINKKN